jgi:hypothetical protein
MTRGQLVGAILSTIVAIAAPFCLVAEALQPQPDYFRMLVWALAGTTCAIYLRDVWLGKPSLRRASPWIIGVLLAGLLVQEGVDHPPGTALQWVSWLALAALFIWIVRFSLLVRLEKGQL